TTVSANVHLLHRNVLCGCRRTARLKNREITLARPYTYGCYQYCDQVKNTLSHKWICTLPSIPGSSIWRLPAARLRRLSRAASGAIGLRRRFLPEARDSYGVARALVSALALPCSTYRMRN